MLQQQKTFIKSTRITKPKPLLMTNNQQYFLSVCLLSFLFLKPVFANNSTCSEALIVGEGTYEVKEFSGDGAIFQGATSAVWYRYESVEKGVFTVSSCSGGGDTRLVIMLMEDCANQSDLQIINSEEDNCPDGKGGNTASTIEVVAVPNISYLIYWDNGQSDDAFAWNLTFEPETSQLAGSNCQSAQIIEEGIHTVDALSGIGAAFSDAVSARWYVFLPQKVGDLFINACESEVNTRLFVWEGVCGVNEILGQDDDGCGESGASRLNNIKVEEGKSYYIYWDDHHSAEGFNFSIEVKDSTVAIHEPVWAKTIDIFPNPANHSVFINYNFQTTKDLQLTIYNYLGQPLIKEQLLSFNKGQLEIPISHFSTGTYFLKLESGFEIFTKKIIKN